MVDHRMGARTAWNDVQDVKRSIFCECEITERPKLERNDIYEQPC